MEPSRKSRYNGWYRWFMISNFRKCFAKQRIRVASRTKSRSNYIHLRGSKHHMNSLHNQNSLRKDFQINWVIGVACCAVRISYIYEVGTHPSLSFEKSTSCACAKFWKCAITTLRTHEACTCKVVPKAGLAQWQSTYFHEGVISVQGTNTHFSVFYRVSHKVSAG